MTPRSARTAAAAATLAGVLALTGSAATAGPDLPDLPILGDSTTTTVAPTTTLAPPPPAFWIYFSRSSQGVHPDLWRVDPATITAADPDGDAQPVTAVNTDAWEYSADVSPDGRTLAFVSDRDGDDDIYLLDLVAPGAQPVQLTKNTTADRAPAWAPDGRSIAYVGWVPIAKRTTAQRVQITKIADGTTRTISDSEPHQHDTPAWNPDGTELAFSAGYHNDADLFIADVASGTVTRRLTDGPVKDVHRSPDWSPDGTSIVYTRQEVAGSTRDLDLFVVAAGGGRPVPVVTGVETSAEQGEWHPGGRSIVFSGLSQQHRQLHLVTRGDDGQWGPPVRLLTSDGYDTQPTWATVAP